MKKFLNIFCDWDFDPSVSHVNLLCKLITGACDWLDSRPSRQNKATQFLKFLIFCKNKKTFQKQLKHSKIVLCLINKNWVCETHLIKYNHTNEYGIRGYQKWDSPLSNVKVQWSIQPRHTQLALDRVTNLNYRNMHIWPPT